MGTFVPPEVHTQAALDPFGWVILAIVVFNLMAPLFARRKPKPAPVQPAAAPAPTAPPAVQTFRTITDADRARLRGALAQGGIAALATELQWRQAQASTTPPAVATLPAAAPAYARLVPQISLAQTAAGLSASVLSPAALPAPALPPMATTDGLTLMSLESGATAFNRLAINAQNWEAGGPALTLRAIASPGALASAFVAAAIVGPCAALRPLGHTPAGW